MDSSGFRRHLILVVNKFIAYRRRLGVIILTTCPLHHIIIFNMVSSLRHRSRISFPNFFRVALFFWVKF